MQNIFVLKYFCGKSPPSQDIDTFLWRGSQILATSFCEGHQIILDVSRPLTAFPSKFPSHFISPLARTTRGILTESTSAFILGTFTNHQHGWAYVNFITTSRPKRVICATIVTTPLITKSPRVCSRLFQYSNIDTRKSKFHLPSGEIGSGTCPSATRMRGTSMSSLGHVAKNSRVPVLSPDPRMLY